METLLLSINEIERAAEIIKRGGLVAFPTETVYGLGGDALNADSARAIYAAKGRPSDNPLIVHIADFAEVDGLAESVPEEARKLAEACWPGPLTMVLPKKAAVPDATTGGLKTVAIRMPMDSAALQLIKLSGCPIAAPSANVSGRPSPTRWQHVSEDLDGRIDAIICGDDCTVGIESTVLDLTDPKHPQVLRPGYFTPKDIAEILGTECTVDPAVSGRPDANLVPKAPGMKYRHYAPKAEMVIYRGANEDVRRAIEEEAHRRTAEGKRVTSLIYDEGKDAAARLFADLRAADDAGADVILATALPEDGSVNNSVMNRMLKAAGYNIKEV